MNLSKTYKVLYAAQFSLGPQPEASELHIRQKSQRDYYALTGSELRKLRQKSDKTCSSLWSRVHTIHPPPTITKNMVPVIEIRIQSEHDP